MSERIDEQNDPFPLLEETDEGVQLPTLGEWLEGGAPMREVASPEQEKR